MAEDREQSERGFVVVDRRGQESEAEKPPTEPSGEAPREASRGPRELPVDFTTFVLSLGTSALFHMGLMPEPTSGESAPEPNLPLASQTIDTLAMLQARTRGNLDEEEAKLLENLLYELRMRFVDARRRPPAGAAGD